MQEAVSKGEFAQIIGVSPGRVSQYLTEGKISVAALVGVGRNAKINVERAKADLRLTLDVSQRLGNGSETNIEAGISAPPAHNGPSSTPEFQLRGIDHDIKQQKFEQLKRANRNAAIADALERGTLVEKSRSQAEMARVASTMLDVFEGGITDFAMAIAAKFELPQRDVKHELRRVYREVRERAAKQMRDKSIDLDAIVQTEIEADDTEQSEVT
ncbi:MAG: hypothetical protein JWR80_7995 [Bradyrhizobium sp.]|nr:hypothetical protein [Bradyrhizobium sp.]